MKKCRKIVVLFSYSTYQTSFLQISKLSYSCTDTVTLIQVSAYWFSVAIENFCVENFIKLCIIHLLSVF